MVSLGLRWENICQQTALARKILWHTGWVRSLPSTLHYEGVCNEAMKPAHASLPPFYCCYGGASLCYGPAADFFCLDLPAHFLFCPQLILQLFNRALPIEKSCLTLSPLPQHHPCMWVWNSSLSSFCPLIMTWQLYQPLIFRLLVYSTQQLGAGFSCQEPGELPAVVMRKKDRES